MPRISVLMSVRNAESFVDESVNSIANQSYPDFEFLVADDASTDKTLNRLENLAKSDHRLRIFRNEKQLGVAASLNRLIDEARGEYIARMDGDDIAVSDRFEVQLPVLESGQADLCGGWVSAFGDQKESVVKFPVDDADIRAHLLFWNPINHPTVMMRRMLLGNDRYSEHAEYPRDYGLWQRLALKGRMHNVPRVLLRYRRHLGQTASTHSREQIEGAANLAIRYLDMLGIAASEREKFLHGRIRHRDVPASWQEVAETEAWLLKLAEWFEQNGFPKSVLADQWYKYCLKAASKGPRAYRKFRGSPLRRFGQFSGWQDKAVLFLGLLRVRYGSPFYRYLAVHSPAARR